MTDLLLFSALVLALWQGCKLAQGSRNRPIHPVPLGLCDQPLRLALAYPKALERWEAQGPY
jgi:hypothetical protein